METIKEVYEEIVRLTSEIEKTGVAKKIFDAAKELDGIKKVEEIFETFKSENPELHMQIISFGMIYNELPPWLNVVFGTSEKGMYVFDTNVIDPLSFYFLVLIAEIDEFNVFEAWFEDDDTERFTDSLKEAGYVDLAEFINSESAVVWIGNEDKQYSNFYELLVAIFNGEFADE